ncbi:MAG TPA: type IV secretion system DNA-binding domain-containing protein [Thermoanaerobaculia bacterium]|nr:type IV secretion system DNA-binding domain-containing protein [Thermoanaerobaculia bacterium]
MPEPTLPERLTEQFYAWELRGRGWQEFAHPVALEPPFRPFPGYFLPPIKDDGHRPGLLGRLFAPRRPEPGIPETLEPEPETFESDEALVECAVSLPSEVAVKAESAERFLLALSAAELPLAFEIVGLPESLTVQVVCRAPDAALLGNQLRAFFPEVSIQPEPEGLRHAWTREQGETVLLHFGLAREFMLPLASFRSLDPDPLLPLFGALAELEPGEAGLVQVLFERVREEWAENVMRSVVTPRGEPFFADYPELTKAAREKISRPLFAACIRVAAKSTDTTGAWRIVRDLAGALTHFGTPAGNELLPLATLEGGEAMAEICSRTSRRPGMILGSDELAALAHLPGASVRVPKLLREIRRSKAAPALSQGAGILLGENLHHGRVLPVRLPNDLRLRHLHVIGASGSGKSTLLLDLISQDIEAGRGVALLDPHGDLVDEIVGRIPEERLDDAILFDPADTSYPVAWNILEAHSELERTLLASDLVGIFRRFSTSWGDQMTSVLGNAVLVLLENPGSTLLDLREFLVDRPTRERLLAVVEDPYLTSYFRHEFQLAAGKSVGAILTRLDGFLRSKTVRQIVGARESRLDLRTVVDRGQVFLARLSQGAIGEENAGLLGSLLVSKFHQITMSRQEVKREERRPFFLYADECQEVATASMAQLLAGARKYGLGLTLAHQDLRQLDAKAPEVSSALLGNAGTRIAFRVGDRDAKALSEGLSFFGPADLMSLRVGEAIARIDNAQGDCNLKTRLLPPVPTEVATERRETVTLRSRERYAVRREEPQRAEPARKPPPPAVAPEAPRVAPEPEPREPPRVEAPFQPVAPAPPPPKRATREEAPVPPLGRGGPEHQYLQDLVKRWAESHGYRATIEEEIPEGKGKVDVALRTDDFSLACEISVTSTVAQEVGNVLKCLDAGFHEVAILALKRPRLQKIEAVLKAKLPPSDLARVHLVSPEELFTMLSMRPVTKEKVVGGYKVRVRRTPVDSEEEAARYQALKDVIGKSLRRMGKKEKP